jgi:hypothetical protein
LQLSTSRATCSVRRQAKHRDVLLGQSADGLNQRSRFSGSCKLDVLTRAGTPATPPAPRRHTSPALRGLSRSPEPLRHGVHPAIWFSAGCGGGRTFPPPSLTYPSVRHRLCKHLLERGVQVYASPSLSSNETLLSSARTNCSVNLPLPSSRQRYISPIFSTLRILSQERD